MQNRMTENKTRLMTRNLVLLTIGTVFLVFTSCSSKNKNPIDLQGIWTYRLDTSEVGEHQQWFNQEFTHEIHLPGALRDYGIGDDPSLTTDWTGSIYDSSWFFNPATKKFRETDEIKFPFWLTPVKHFKGMAWFQREVVIPENWKDTPLLLTLERPHWQTKVWLDSILLGNDNSLSTPHRFMVPAKKVKPGTHTLTILVDNAIRDIDPGINSHSISDHTQGNWNGIIGSMDIRPASNNCISRVVLTPDIKEKQLDVKVFLSQKEPLKNAKLRVNIKGQNHKQKIKTIEKEIPGDEKAIAFTVSMGDDMKTWSEFSPNLYCANIDLISDNKVIDTKKETFGMREFTIDNLHFEINSTPIFLRGTTECSVFPLTGYPPTNEAEWDRIFNICKSYGLNHMRFHSYCPPEAAFNAADRAGIYLQVEGPSWAKYSTSLGDGKPIDDYLMKETKRIIDEYGNHPSFVMMAYGNEPSGHYVGYLENWVDHFRRYDSRIRYTGASTGRSWAIIENSDFIDRSPPRGLVWKNSAPETMFDYRNNTENQNRPYVTFEMGQWCVFPNFKEIEKYTGSLKARNFEMFREDLTDKHMESYAEDFLMASGKLQASCYKQEIEATLRTPNLAGFQLLSLNDFPGQGTALVGILDAFWDEKGYISADEFSKFCSQIVPLARLPKYTFFNNETLIAQIEVANFSGKVIDSPIVTWQLQDKDGITFGKGGLPVNSVKVGNCNELGFISVPFKDISKASELKLMVAINGHQNDWNIWVYPKSSIPPHNKVEIVSTLTPEVITKLENGAKVLLMAAGKVEHGKDIVHYQTPVFWNTSWFRMRPPHTTGLLINNDHPVFNDFPTNYYSDQQWWELTNRQQVMNLDSFPADFKGIVTPIDTWFMNRKLSMLFEATVGKGRLVVCSMDLNSDPENKKVADYFYNCILNYMNSDNFNPKQQLEISYVTELFEKKDRPEWKSYVHGAPE